MLSQVYYLVRSRVDGSYLAAYPDRPEDAPRSPETGYLIVFREHFDALSYLNKFGSGMSEVPGSAPKDRFSVESVPGTQLDGVLKRWNFKGVGIVQDPLIPRVEFLSRE